MGEAVGRGIWPRNILAYGQGGMGKSTLAARAAAYLWKTEGLRARVVNADGGGTESAFSPLIAAGAAEVWHIDQWDEKALFSNLDQATQGFWPADPLTPGSPLLPPTRDWKPCPFCAADSGGKGLGMVATCATCGKPFPPGTFLKQKRELINGAEQVGIYVFEGISRFGELLLQRLKKIDPSGGNSISEENFKISSPGQAHYLMAQSYMGQFVGNTRRIPVPLTFWTALEMRSDEDGKPIYGPKGPGKALTAAMIPWFTDVLHIDGFQKKLNGVTQKDKDGVEVLERRMFIAPHFPPDNPSQRFAAKTSVPFGGEMPLSMEPDMTLFFDTLKKAYEKAAAQLLS